MRDVSDEHLTIPPGERIAYVRSEVANGGTVTSVCRQVEISEATNYLWTRTGARLGISSLGRLQQLEQKNRPLKDLVAELTGDKLTFGEPGRRRV